MNQRLGRLRALLTCSKDTKAAAHIARAHGQLQNDSSPGAYGAARLHATRLDRHEGERMKWMPSCRRVAELLSQRLDEPLTPVDQFRLRLHLSLCGDCRNVDAALVGIRAAAADLFFQQPGVIGAFELDGDRGSGVGSPSERTK